MLDLQIARMARMEINWNLKLMDLLSFSIYFEKTKQNKQTNKQQQKTP